MTKKKVFLRKLLSMTITFLCFILAKMGPEALHVQKLTTHKYKNITTHKYKNKQTNTVGFGP